MTGHRQQPNLISIDIGGTFTDFVIFIPQKNKLLTHKLLSTPDNPAQAVIDGMVEILAGFDPEELTPETPLVITHGSTIATNALLERKGARTALITTHGFEDILEIGRQDRPSLYNFSDFPEEPLVPAEMRFGVDERVDNKGNVLVELKDHEIRDLLPILNISNTESIAVCLLFSFLHPQHEEVISAQFRSAGYFVSSSIEILPEYREYERTSTTVVNAYLSPVVDRYLGDLESSLTELTPNSHLRIMQSNGGIIGLKDARREGVRGILSGPAGGVVGANQIAASTWGELNSENVTGSARNPLEVISFDMGGTSTDVSLIAGEPSLTSESNIGGFPIRIPVLDIHTIGAGGGSIAHIDAGGALRIGPQSAGADPGPACYALRDSKFDLPTVTDANVVLGRLPHDHFLGGQMRLDPDRAYSVISKLGEGLELDAIQTAKGIIDIVNSHMERALRLVSVERGHDPREILLVSFGGAGGLHACKLAGRLGIRRIVVSPLASTLSAYGMSVADVVKDYSRTIMLPGSTTAEKILTELQPLLKQGEKDILSEGFSQEEIILEASLDMRYAGQSFELNVPFYEKFAEEFHQIHKLTYGYARHGAEVEVVNIRVRATGKISPPPLPTYSQSEIDPDSAQIDERLVHLSNGSAEIPLYKGESLMPGNQVFGPALVVRKDTTIFLDLHDNGVIDKYGNLVIQNSS